MSKKTVGKLFISFFLIMIIVKTLFLSTPISIGTLIALVLCIRYVKRRATTTSENMK